jgi:anti-sigma regulatory factor (Ser/Thr protein kinase)
MRSAADAGTTFTLRIERSMAELGRLAGWVDTVAAGLRLDTRAEYALRLCVEEAASNVVMHGTPGDDGDADYVALRVEPLPDVLRLTVEDHCGAFDPRHVLPPDTPTSLEEARIGGLGIHLMRQYARAMDYARVDGMNRLTLTIGR